MKAQRQEGEGLFSRGPTGSAWGEKQRHAPGTGTKARRHKGERHEGRDSRGWKPADVCEDAMSRQPSLRLGMRLIKGLREDDANAIAQALLHDTASVRIIFPTAKYKDLRTWAPHTDRAEIETAIKAAPPVKLRIRITVHTRERQRRRQFAHIH